ncbi:unnamed protein product, partial [Allacma fusca]
MMMMFIPGATLLIQNRKYRTGKITKIHSNDECSSKSGEETHETTGFHKGGLVSDQQRLPLHYFPVE